MFWTLLHIFIDFGARTLCEGLILPLGTLSLLETAADT